MNVTNDVIMSATASQITSLTIVNSTVYSDESEHQSSASLAFVRGIRQWPGNTPHKGLVTRKMFPFDNVIMFRKCDEHYCGIQPIYTHGDIMHRSVSIVANDLSGDKAVNSNKCGIKWYACKDLVWSLDTTILFILILTLLYFNVLFWHIILTLVFARGLTFTKYLWKMTE